MATGKKITELAILTTLDPLDLITVVDLSEGANRRMQYSDLLAQMESEVTITEAQISDLQDYALDSALTVHVSDTGNPHSVTQAQVGLSNVDNTSDINKPISTATQSALDDKLNLSGGTLTGALSGTTFNGVALTTSGSATNFLNEEGNYVAVAGGGPSFGTSGQIPRTNGAGTDFDYSNDLFYNGINFLLTANNLNQSSAGTTSINLDTTSTATATGFSAFNDESLASSIKSFCSAVSDTFLGISASNKGVISVGGASSLGLIIATDEAQPISIGTGDTLSATISGSTQDWDFNGNALSNAASYNGVALTASGSATNFLNEQGNYVAVAGGGVNIGSDNQLPVVNAAGTDFEYNNNYIYDGALKITTTSGAVQGMRLISNIDSSVYGSFSASSIDLNDTPDDRQLFIGNSTASPNTSVLVPIVKGFADNSGRESLVIHAEVGNTNDTGSTPAMSLVSNDDNTSALNNRPTLAGFNDSTKQWEVAANGNWNHQGNDLTNVGSLTTGGTVTMNSLPTSNPGGSGILWNDSGTLKIT